MTNQAMLTLARNVRTLMERRGWSQVTLARKAGVGQTTLSALLRYGDGIEKTATMDTVQAIARALGVEAWVLQIPELPPDLFDDRGLLDLVHTYAETDSGGREHLVSVAEREAAYHHARERPKAG